MSKYCVSELLTHQINDIYKQLKKNVILLTETGISRDWVNNYLGFLEYVKKYGENRLKQ